MKTKNILLLGFILVITGACTDYLDPYPNDELTNDLMWEYPSTIQGLIGKVYDYIPTNYNDNEGAYLDCATDNAVSTSSTRDMRKFALNTVTTNQDPFKTYWARDYKAIYLCNFFLKDRKGYNLRYLIVPRLNDLVRRRLQGEAYGLRAWFEWDLLQKFGGRGTDSKMLGFPIIKEPVDITTGVNNFARSTYDECVKQILDDCDSAYKYLPLAHRDFLVPVVTDRQYAGARYWGRIDGISTRAIKAMVYLTWASPRFNPGNDLSRWDNAAKNAKEVMDFKLMVDNVTGGFVWSNGVNWVDPNFAGIIWPSRNNTSDVMERMFYPGGFQGNGTMGATQDMIDAFPMANGYPIKDTRSAYDSTKPYVGRDPRFYAMIFYNNALAKQGNTGATMYTFENWQNGGKDAAGVSSSNSLTNYHIKKFVYMGLNLNATTKDIQRHSKFIIRWAHMCLVFAEAANQYAGPTNAATYGITAKDAIKYLRGRKTYDGTTGLGATKDPYLDEVAVAGKAAFDLLVKNERRIETCFEGMRFYDLRRWSTDLASLNKSVHGIRITRKTDGSFSYSRYEVENRVYTSAYIPIPYDEMLRMSNLVQNEGWTTWN